MEAGIAVLIFLFINTLFLPYHDLLPKRHFRSLVGQIQDEEVSSTILSTANIMEKIFKYSEKYYKFIKNKTPYERYLKYEKDLVVAGLADNVTPEGILAGKLFLGLAVLIYIATCGFLFRIPFLLTLSPIGAIIGYIYPDSFIKGKIKERQWQLQKELPNVLNTLAILTEAGLGLFESIEKVCEIRNGEFVKELKKVKEEVQVGVLRKDAFLKMAERCQVYEVSAFVSALVQLMEKGSSGIVSFLKLQSEELWEKRINIARELGAKASLKLFLPMLILVLPATLIFIAGPIVISLISNFF